MSFICPKCHKQLDLKGKSYVCENNHTYDVAKGGYVNLVMHNRKTTGDDKGMVDARTSFLEKGYYQSLQTAICEQLKKLSLHVLVDAGCGQGYYTNVLQKQMADIQIYGFDLSKFALKEACKAHTKVHYAAASVADVPLSDHCADGWISVFAPIYIEEVSRVLMKDGYFIKVGPGPKHLYELKQQLYDSVYDNDSEISSYEGFTHIKRIMIEDVIDIDNSLDIQALFQMTPYYYRSSKGNIMKLEKLKYLHIQLEFTIDIYEYR